MTMPLDELIERIRRLPPVKRRKLEDIVADLEAAPLMEPPAPAPRMPLKGMLQHLGSAPSAEEIDETRRELWNHFPREEQF
ncbi:MAG TPA: hypothetical protein PK156_26550 [Polyangium sp.]|nr:hypothetical protein [Polyangium sp.]